MEFEIGDRLPNGSILVAVKPYGHNPGNPGFVVLAYRNCGEYVTWVSNHVGDTYWGHYFPDFGSAAADFLAR